MNPVLRRMTLEIWYADWNEANQRAREAYYQRLDEMEAPRLCRRQRHLKPPGQHGGCQKCRNELARERRASKSTYDGVSRLSIQQKDQVVALYTDELLIPLEIARLFGVTRSTVRNILVERGVHIRSYSEACKAIQERNSRTTQPEQENLSA